MTRDTLDLRAGIVDLLRLLCSPGEQRDYERRVPAASVPTELVSMWFDDQYLPDSPVFIACFSARELEAMAVFSKYFADREKLLPDTPNGIQSWLETETWQGIMREAGRALAAFEH